MTLPFDVLRIPFLRGLTQGVDPRALPPPGLSIAKDVECDERGGLQTRKPYSALGLLDSAGATIANPRKVVAHSDELLLFTKTALYTRNTQSSRWMNRGTHLAIDVSEQSRFVTTDDQIECDRAELNGVIVYAWAVTVPGVIYVAAIDKTTGATILAPTITSVGETRPRLVALTTKILLFVVTGDPSLVVYAIDPASPGTAIAGGATNVLITPDFNSYYDAVKIAGADTAAFVARRTPTTSYEVGKVTAGLTVTKSTKARTCDGPIAVSSDPTGATLQVVRGNGTNIQGDRITTSSLADAATGQAVGTCTGTLNQIAACHRSVQDGGQYRCYAFWSSAETANGAAAAWECKTNYVDTGGGLGTQSRLIYRLGVASRAFDYDGRVFVWLAFAGTSEASGVGQPLGFRAQLQNSYFLYRDDGHLASKCAFQVAGGFSPLTGWLAGVALTSGSTTYSWCATERRIITLGNDERDARTGYDARAPRDVVFTFDSDRARRVVRLGKTAYVAGGLPLQYDGAGIWEIGFLVYPWSFAMVVAGAGALPAGDYVYKVTERWDNANGERERSTTASAEKFTSAGAQKPAVDMVPLHVTRKANAPALEIWRTQVNPGDGAPFYLVTGIDPAVITGDNCYIANKSTTGFSGTWNDNFTDTTLATKQTFDEDSGAIEHLSPAGARVIFATDTRMFLGDVAGSPDRVWYSRLRGEGEIVAFHDSLFVDVPPQGGRITAIWATNESLYVARETAIYALPGVGFDNTGGGNNFGPALEVSQDVGAVNQESVAITPNGALFKSNKGWYVQRGLGVEYVGSDVAGYDSETPVAVHIVESQHQVRCLTANRLLVWDYLADAWFEWTVAGGLGACMWRGSYVYVTAANVFQEDTNATYTYGLDVETGWIDLAGKQGYGFASFLQLLGGWESAHRVRIRVARDYETVGVNPKFFDDKHWTADGQAAGDTLLVRHGLTRIPSTAVKVRITAVGTDSTSAFLAVGVAGAWTSGGTIATSGTAWTATLIAKQVGTGGNLLFLSVYTSIGATGVEVRDNEQFDGTTWNPLDLCVGVRVGGTITVKQLETAIGDSSKLIGILSADPTPTKTITDTNTLHTSKTLQNGTPGVDATPTGAALKLTALALEVAQRAGLNKHLPSGRRQ